MKEVINIFRNSKVYPVRCIFNILEIWKKVRKNLSGEDFSGLDLRECRFYERVCSIGEGKLKDATEFYNESSAILNLYVTNVQYISTVIQMNQLLAGVAEKNDIFIFFTSEKGEYADIMLKVIKKYNEAQSRIWAIAMESNPECRRPPEPVTDKQSFDVSCRRENRNPLKNNIKAIAQLFARKIVAQTLSPLYRDEVLYFISHRRSDGEHIAAKLADGLRLLTRERNVYRDVVNVEVGDDAQKDIDKHLAVSDVLIFLQTQQAQYSSYIIKELCYALINDIPILLIQIDNASYDKMEIHPGQGPVLSYRGDEFDSKDRLEEIVDEVEDKCFQLMMNSSNQVYSYVQYLNEMRSVGKIKLTNDIDATLAYGIEYCENTRDLYDSGIRKHYIQCFGRNPQGSDIQNFIDRVKREKSYDRFDKLFLLSQRITPKLVSILKKHAPIYLNTQFNHPLEITPESIDACNLLADSGIMLGNQMVLLKGVNNDKYVVQLLNRQLIKLRVRPYYIFHAKDVKGTMHFQTSLKEGIEILSHLCGNTSGLSIPRYIVSAPNGLGKISISQDTLSKENHGNFELVTWEGKRVTIPNESYTRFNKG